MYIIENKMIRKILSVLPKEEYEVEKFQVVQNIEENMLVLLKDIDSTTIKKFLGRKQEEKQDLPINATFILRPQNSLKFFYYSM